MRKRIDKTTDGSTTVTNKYDYMGRRISKSVDGVETEFLYDGWNLVQETTGTNVTQYVWGLDLSQSLQGAGGVGGLLCVIENGDEYYPCYDSNGNITEYVDSTGTVVAHYEYSAFGKITAQNGAKDDDFAFRFSTKYYDTETGLYAYGYRYYNSDLGRWINRDPIGNINVLQRMIHASMSPRQRRRILAANQRPYCFVRNAAVVLYDYLGLTTSSEKDFNPCECIKYAIIFQNKAHDGYINLPGARLVLIEPDSKGVVEIGEHGARVWVRVRPKEDMPEQCKCISEKLPNYDHAQPWFPLQPIVRIEQGDNVLNSGQSLLWIIRRPAKGAERLQMFSDSKASYIYDTEFPSPDYDDPFTVTPGQELRVRIAMPAERADNGTFDQCVLCVDKKFHPKLEKD